MSNVFCENCQSISISIQFRVLMLVSDTEINIVHTSHTKCNHRQHVFLSLALFYRRAFFASMTLYMYLYVQTIESYIRSIDAQCMEIFPFFPNIDRENESYLLFEMKFLPISFCSAYCHISSISIKWTVLMNCLTSHATFDHRTNIHLQVLSQSRHQRQKQPQQQIYSKQSMHSVIDRFKENITRRYRAHSSIIM